jgi:hypothetical protein
LDDLKLRNIGITLVRLLLEASVVSLIELYNVLLSSALFLLLNAFNELVVLEFNNHFSTKRRGDLTFLLYWNYEDRLN